MSHRSALAFSPLILGMLAARAHAIGLGDIHATSFINEPFKAEITLIGAKGIAEQDLILGLAANEEFARAGIEKNMALRDLRFRVDLESNPPKVVVTSPNPFREPYLNFLVSAQWPQGGLLREYTVLLDLPSDRSRLAAASLAASSLAATQGQGSRAVGSLRRDRSDIQAGDAVYGPVVTGDSAWKIAATMQRPEGMSLPALIDALVDLNPQAFTNGDPARLRVGQMLVLPEGVTPASQQSVAGNGSAEVAVPAKATGQTALSPPMPAPVESPVSPDRSAIEATNRALREAEMTTKSLAAELEAKEAKVNDLINTLDSQSAELAKLQEQIAQGATTPEAQDAGSGNADAEVLAEMQRKIDMEATRAQAMQIRAAQAEKARDEAQEMLAQAEAAKSKLVAVQAEEAGAMKTGWPGLVVALMSGFALALGPVVWFVRSRRKPVVAPVANDASTQEAGDISEWADMQQQAAPEVEPVAAAPARAALVTSKEVSARVGDTKDDMGLADIVFEPHEAQATKEDAAPVAAGVVTQDPPASTPEVEERFGAPVAEEPVEFLPTLDLDGLLESPVQAPADAGDILDLADGPDLVTETRVEVVTEATEAAVSDTVMAAEEDRDRPHASETDAAVSFADDAKTKIALADAYINLGDKDGARELLQEVIEDGVDVVDEAGVAEVVAKARELLAKIGE